VPTVTVRSSVTTNEHVNRNLTSHSSATNLGSNPQTPPHKRHRTTLQPYSAGELGKWAVQHAQLMERLGWQQYFHRQQHPSSMHPRIGSLPHPTAEYLHELASTGVPAYFADDPCTVSQLDSVLARGPHRSAAAEFAEFLVADMFDYVQMGYWIVLPYTSVRHLPNLRLAPAGVVPQRERRPRPIMDYSFYNTNAACLPYAPLQAMQFGTALPRLLERLVYCNRTHGPPVLAKIDLADGYYRVPLSPAAALALAVLIPTDLPHDPTPLVALPLTLPMGWAQSPPYFCAFTETVTDLTNQATLSLHPKNPLLEPTQCTLEPVATDFHPTAVTLGGADLQPLTHADVYIDDFLLVAQRPYQLPLMNTFLNALDTVFHDPTPTNRRQLVSASKLDKGDATFATQKRILGWDIDTHVMTLSLPSHRLEGMTELINNILDRKRVSRTTWQRLLGTLRSTSPALYGAKHLFSTLQHALRDQRGRRIRLTALIRASLLDWTILASTANSLPVPLHTVVPHPPHIIGATDASKQGMGGFYIIQSTQGPEYYLWRAAFPPSISNALTSSDNPTGFINNSDLELAGLVLGSTVIAQSHKRPYQHICLASDNTPAVTWVTKGSTTSNGPPAYLLHMLAQSRRSHQYQLTVPFTTGLSNTIADCCSRLFHLNDDTFLQHMRHRFPIKPCWKLVPVPTETLSATNSALLKKLQKLRFMPRDETPLTLHGTFGTTFAQTSVMIPSSKTLPTQYPCFKSLPTDIDRAPWLPAGLRLSLERWKEPYVPLARRWPHWAAPIHASSRQENWTCVYPDNSRLIKNKTQPLHVSNPYHYQSSHRLRQSTASPTHRLQTLWPICSSLDFSSSYAQANMPAPPTPTRPRSASATST